MKKEIEITKAGKDSYSTDKFPEGKNLAGTLQYAKLSKKNYRTLKDIDLLYLMMYKSECNGYDYVLLAPHRTNSGRWEAVRNSKKAINIGKELYRRGYIPEKRTPDAPKYALRVGDVFCPDMTEPSNYDDLPECTVEPVQVMMGDPTVEQKGKTVITEKLTVNSLSIFSDPNSEASRMLEYNILVEAANTLLRRAEELLK